MLQQHKGKQSYTIHVYRANWKLLLATQNNTYGRNQPQSDNQGYEIMIHLFVLLEPHQLTARGTFIYTNIN